MAPRLRLLRTAWRDRELNLALEWALVELVSSGRSSSTLRLWTNPPCVVIGRSGLSLAEVRAKACEEFGIPVLRRPTAGGAVYHDEGNLNWTIAIQKEELSKPAWPEELEHRASGAILRLLGELGLDGHHEARKGVFVGGRKVSGMAMYVGRRAVMVHGTLLVSSDLSALRAALRCKFEVANISELVGSELDLWADVAPLLAEQLAKAFGARVVEGRLSQDELALAEALRPKTRPKRGPR